MSARELLAKARNILVTRGWTQRRFHRVNDGYCAMGALYSAAGVSDKELIWSSGFVAETEELTMAREALHRVIGFDIMWWNDLSGRTAEQVITAFERAEVSLP